MTFLVERHLPRRLRAERAARHPAGIRPTTAIALERKAMARDLLAEVRRLDRELAAHCDRIREVVIVSGTTLTEPYGVGSLVAAYLIGQPISAADQQAREDTRDDSNGQRDRLCTLTAGSSVKSLPDPPQRYASAAPGLTAPRPDTAT